MNVSPADSTAATSSTDLLPVRRALLSVSDKTGLVDLGAALAARGVELISTGGTATALRAAGLTVRDVSDVTGFPEMMDGRVKTLHPKVHGGLLARRDLAAHLAAAEAHGAPLIDLLVVNLYPFEATIAAGAGREEAIEQIDIGGPALIRAAAKNHAAVAVLTDPTAYAGVLGALAEHDGATPLALRRALAAAAFARTAAYDAAVAAWCAAELTEEGPLPERLTISGARVATLRYGENPHQRAAFYRAGPTRPGVATARQAQGKALSYNNLNDADAAFELVAELDRFVTPACVIVKHANPCGAALGRGPSEGAPDPLADAYARAMACDPVSAFGGVVALNRPVTAAAARRITAIFTEVLIAPEADADALEILAAKRDLRVLLTGALPDPAASGVSLRPVAGGFLAQERDAGWAHEADWTVVTQRPPSADELRDLGFAWAVAKHVKSNAIVYAKALGTVGVGAGQMSRVDSTRIAAWKAEEMARAAGSEISAAQGSVVASDAFFPFPDGVETAARAGATALAQPGGSIRDQEVIAAADALGLAMVFTGMRHFKH